MKPSAVTKKLMDAVAAELNKVMGLNPPILVDKDEKGNKITKETLKPEIVEAASELQISDKISKQTAEVLVALGVTLPEAPPTSERKPVASAPKTDKKKRVDVFADIMRAGGGTKKEIAEKMNKAYGGSEAEATFQTNAYLSVLTAFGYATKDENGRFALA